ncbi:6-phosphofructokinase [Ornithinimicrobium sp. CNJ-824]|uniref:6-phosphofructokinase n=1 Tax=Ornithinimicrobium sp. CNJ-824 TaxID=1904966 RepID=UPI000A890B9A|nr:6-phosphofructokinase [Ornithinimicrobium sp. CNJ-824]
MRIGILTGGGDVPGLNPCIKAVVNRVHEEGHQVTGIRRGWGGLLSTDLDDPASVAENLVDLDPVGVRTVDRTGGTFLHSSRTNPGKVKTGDVPDFLAGAVERDGPHDLTPHVLKVIEAAGIDVLIPIGGDDTLSYGLRMHQEGVPTIAIPKTMDNDVNGTDYCIGFSTAVTRGVQFIHNLRTSTGSHERIAVVELFGRYSGETSLITAYLAGVDRALIPEVPFDVDRVCELLLADKAANPSNYAMVTISEGATVKGGDMMLTGEADATGTASSAASGRSPASSSRSGRGRGSSTSRSATSCARGARTPWTSWSPPTTPSWPPTWPWTGRPGGWWRCATAATAACRSR